MVSQSIAQIIEMKFFMEELLKLLTKILCLAIVMVSTALAVEQNPGTRTQSKNELSSSKAKNPYQKIREIYAAGHYSQAIVEITKALDKHPGDYELQFLLAAAYVDDGNLAKAKQVIEKYLKKYPDNQKLVELKRKLVGLVAKHPKKTAAKQKKTIAKKRLVQSKKSTPKIKKPDTSERVLEQISQDPDNIPLRVKAIYILESEKRYKEALALAKQGLAEHPSSLPLLYAYGDITLDLEQYDKTAVAINDILNIQPDDARALSMLVKVKRLDKYRISGLNTIFITSYPTSVVSQGQFWLYVDSGYIRRTSVGAFGAGSRYARRLGSSGYQGYVAAWPQLYKNLSLYLEYAYSDSPLFSRHTYISYLYFPFGPGVQLMMGYEYREILNTSLKTIVGSIDRHFGPWWAIFTVKGYLPKEGINGALFIMQARYFFNPNVYWYGSYLTGLAPDLADLTSVGFFMIHTNSVYTGVNFLIAHGLFMNLGVAYINEAFPGPSRFVRRRIEAAAGMSVRF